MGRGALILLIVLLASAAHAAPFVPEWSKRVVWYQIFPERFRNGDPSNDPRLIDQKGSWPHDHTSPWKLSPWGSDWFELQPWEKENGKDVWFNIQRRRYGGDLQGVLDKLDYLEDLGINAIYLNPIFASPSLHKYDAYLYHHVDPNFGPDPEGDRKLIASENPSDPRTWHWTAADKLALKLIKEAHKRNIRVVFDGVFNHIGLMSPFFQDVIQQREKSPYRDWFTIKSFEPLEYEGWFGVKELPEWREDERGLVAGPKSYIFAITRRWMDPSGQGRPQDGVDGWRLDVAFCVKHGFWKDWSKLVKSINPDAYMTAEIIDTVEANKPYLEGDEFTAVMNYNFAFTATEFFMDRRFRISPSTFDKRLKELRNAYDRDITYAQQNLLDSHDTARAASHVVNADLVAMRNWSKYCDTMKASNKAFDPRRPNAAERQRLKLAVVFQMTYVGAPMVYYGDEMAMWGGNDPDCRKPMIWADIKYQDEVTNPDQSPRAPDKVAFDKEMFDHYRKLIHLRRASAALQTGDFRTLLVDDKRESYGFARRHGREEVVVFLNRSARPQTFALPSGRYTNALQPGTVYRTVRVAPLSAAVLKRN